jgi:hypothetical protein
MKITSPTTAATATMKTQCCERRYQGGRLYRGPLGRFDVVFGRGLVAVLPLELAIHVLLIEGPLSAETSKLLAELRDPLGAGVLRRLLTAPEHHPSTYEHHCRARQRG